MGTELQSVSMGQGPVSPQTPPNCVLNMADEEGFSWVFESLVGFLQGPVWEAAVLTFIEKNSVVFDPVEANEEEYKKIHDEYKNLVDTMLSSHMEDLGISPDEFERACSDTEKSIHSQFRRSLFEQLWAADDYEIFKRMMTHKNLELQLQALDLLAHQYGILPESFLPAEDYEPSPQEKEIMETVVKRYVEENPEEETNEEEQTEKKEEIQATKAKLEEERQKEIKLMEKAMETSLHDSPKANYKETLETAKISQVTAEDAKQRQEYLKQQREKLLALKKQEREKLLQRYEATGRPRSARAAQKAVTEESNSGDALDPSVLAFRKALAAKLKAEVVDKKP